MADVNNDHRADAVSFFTSGANKGQAWVALNTGTGFAAPQLWSSDSKCVDNAVCRLIDVDGNGAPDIVAKSPGETDTLVWVSLALGSRFGAASQQILLPDDADRSRDPTAHTCFELGTFYWREIEAWEMWNWFYVATGSAAAQAEAQRHMDKANAWWDEGHTQKCW